MSKKIILFLSEMHPGSAPAEYTCPNGGTVTGVQTNEAPVFYLLREHPDISQIICIVTTKAKDSFESFETVIHEQYPAAEIVSVSFEEANGFDEIFLKKFFSYIQTGKDEILLETTGGFRNAAMYLLLLSRMLSYTGIKTIGAVYSNYSTYQIEDVSHLIRMFDLVGGLQELTSFGSVRTLRSYYGETPADPRIARLLSAVEQLSQAITLCRTGLIDAKMEEFNTALQEAQACGDPLMRQLLPAFQKKYVSNKNHKMTIPGLIRWCLDSDMIQQALTVYNERMPSYLIEKSTLLKVEKWVLPYRMRDYEDKSYVLFCRGLLRLGAQGSEDRQYQVRSIRNLESLLTTNCGFTLHCPVAQMQDILRDYLYIKALRNMTNHAHHETSPGQQDVEEYLCGECGYKPLSQITLEDIRSAIYQGLEHMKPTPKKERK